MFEGGLDYLNRWRMIMGMMQVVVVLNPTKYILHSKSHSGVLLPLADTKKQRSTGGKETKKFFFVFKVDWSSSNIAHHIIQIHNNVKVHPL